jgi:hypothetical protein
MLKRFPMVFAARQPSVNGCHPSTINTRSKGTVHHNLFGGIESAGRFQKIYSPVAKGDVHASEKRPVLALGNKFDCSTLKC